MGCDPYGCRAGALQVVSGSAWKFRFGGIAPLQVHVVRIEWTVGSSLQVANVAKYSISICFY